MNFRSTFRSLIAAAGIAACSEIHAADIDSEYSLRGIWKGKLDVYGKEFPITVVFEQPSETSATGYLVSPTHSQGKLPLSRITLKDRKLEFQSEVSNGSFQGRLSPRSGKIRGDWKQDGHTSEVELQRSDGDIVVDRPQNPRGTPSYEIRDVTFPNRFGPHTLAGTLTLPTTSAKPAPAVVLLSGMGPHDRDGTAFGHKPFWVLADYLAERGIAVLRFDDRGVGGSGGTFSHANTLDFATDAWAAVEFLSTLPEINRKQIGLIGQGEGGLVAQITATKREDVVFLVLLGTPAVNGRETILTQSSTIGKGIGLPPEFLELNEQFYEALFRVFSQQVPNIERLAELGRRYEEELRKLSNLDEQLWEGLEDTMLYPLKRAEDPWLAWFVECDPEEYSTQIKIPVLAITGEVDLQMPASVHHPALKSQLSHIGDAAELEVLSGHNHLLQRAELGVPSEYGLLDETISPQALRRIEEWMASTLE